MTEHCDYCADPVESCRCPGHYARGGGMPLNFQQPRFTMLRICREPCDQCPWKGRFHLRPGRLRDIIEDCERRDAYFACHKSLAGPTGKYPVHDQEAICAGWLEAAERRGHVPGQGLRIAYRLNAIAIVDPP